MNKTDTNYDYWDNLENDFGFSYNEMHGIERAMKQVEARARIKALTDVDNLGLLDDSDEWHEFYMKEVNHDH